MNLYFIQALYYFCHLNSSTLFFLSFKFQLFTNKSHMKYRVQKIEQNYNQIRHGIKANKTHNCKLQLYRKDNWFLLHVFTQGRCFNWNCSWGNVRYWSQTVILYCRLNSEFFACYKSMGHFDNYRYASNSLSIIFTFSLVNCDTYICNWTFVVLLYNYRVRETSYIVLNLL